MRPALHPITPSIYKQSRRLLPRVRSGQSMTGVESPYRTEAFVMPSPAEIREWPGTMPETIPVIAVWWEPQTREVLGWNRQGLLVPRLVFSHWRCLNPVVADEYFEVPA